MAAAEPQVVASSPHSDDLVPWQCKKCGLALRLPRHALELPVHHECVDGSTATMPSLPAKAKKIVSAFTRWTMAGQPKRSDERVAELYAICEQCCHFYRKHSGGACKICGCNVNITGSMNKLRWATEDCPDNPPRWLHDLEVPGVSVLTAQERREHNRQIANTEMGKRREQLNEKRNQIREERRKRREERKAKREAKQKATPPAVEPYQNLDPLVWYDRHGNEINHCLRNYWWPASGFIVGGGPSVNLLNLRKLAERGIVSLGINNVAGHVPVAAMTFSDPPEKFHHGIFLDPKMVKFVPVPKLKRRVRAKKADGTFGITAFKVSQCPAVWGYQRDSVWKPEEFLTRPSATWGNGKASAKDNGKPTILFTFFLALRLMHYLGCRRVFLIGVDFAMDDERGYAFGQDRTKGAMRGNNNSYRLANEMCRELLPVFQEDGYEVFNCNPESHLSAFPYLPFEEAIEDARGNVPPEPFDLSGWYEKPGEDEDDRGSD